MRHYYLKQEQHYYWHFIWHTGVKMMNKRRILSVFLTIIMAFLFSASAYASEEDIFLSKTAIDACEKYGKEYNICPELLMAIAEAESSGNPKAENGGCKGLMQVSEKWHKDRMKRLGVTDIFDTKGNILVATDYLYELFEKYEDVGMVLMVYNGDSNAEDYMNGKAELSGYAEKILERSFELEKKSGK